MKKMKNVRTPQGGFFLTHTVGLPFYQLFVFKLDSENNVNFDALSSKCANFDTV